MVHDKIDKSPITVGTTDCAQINQPCAEIADG
jgi:hypothetical protein